GEVVTLSGSGVTAATLPTTAVAMVAAGYTSAAASVNLLSGCAAILPSSGPAFTVNIGEGFAAAFKTQGGALNTGLGSGFAANTETGVYVSSGTANNQANAGTRIRVQFQNIPTG